MPRLARAVVPGLPHHVVQRGNRRQDVFFSDEDRLKCLDMVRESAAKFDVAIRSWCLMTNHVHFVAVPEDEKSLALCLVFRGTAPARLRGRTADSRENTLMPRLPRFVIPGPPRRRGAAPGY